MQIAEATIRFFKLFFGSDVIQGKKLLVCLLSNCQYRVVIGHGSAYVYSTLLAFVCIKTDCEEAYIDPLSALKSKLL